MIMVAKLTNRHNGIIVTIILLSAIPASKFETNITGNYKNNNDSKATGNLSEISFNDDLIDTENSYKKLQELYRDMLLPERYSPLLRPVTDQKKAVHVQLIFQLLELIEIDDVAQKMVTNGIFSVVWKDELLQWDPKNYGDNRWLAPKQTGIWKPDFVLFNSPEKIKMLGSDLDGPPKVNHEGLVYWGYQDILTTSCHLDMAKYPFDEQLCQIKITPLVSVRNEMDIFLPESTVDTKFSAKNYGWELEDTKSEVEYLIDGNVSVPCAKFSLKLRRRPTFFLMNVILPNVFLSFLNCFVFIVPVDSGEKISFGISVLLALAVFMSITSANLPYASDGVPAITSYLSSLLTNCIVAVIITIVNVRLHHWVKKDQENNDRTALTSSALKLATSLSLSAIKTQLGEQDYNNDKDYNIKLKENTNNHNIVHMKKRLETMLKYTDTIGFVIVTGIWTGVTVWYFVHVTN